MYTVKISVEKPKNNRVSYARISDLMDGWLGALYTNGQVMEKSVFHFQNQGAVCAVVTLPEKDALAKKYNSGRVIDAVAQMDATGLGTPLVEVLGKFANAGCICRCKSPSSYILFTAFLATLSPLSCGDCFGAVPFYKVAHEEEDIFYDLRSWASAYKACDTLFIGSSVLEDTALREMNFLGSDLSKNGLKACKQISQETGVPVYYYLHQYNAQNLNDERQRKCPSCGGDWLLSQQLFGLFDFKCDRCCLLSNIAVSIDE